MTLCDDVQDGLDGYLDGELRDAGLANVEEHLGRCPVCSARLIEALRMRRLTGEVFSSQLVQAPPVPEGLAERMMETLEAGDTTRKSGSSRSLVAVLVSVAALVVVGIGISLIPQADLSASPMVALTRATERYKELQDVELWVRFESEAIRALNMLFGQDEKEDEAEMPAPMRVLVQAPTRFLYQEVEDLEDPEGEILSVGGFNGTQNWSYNPEKNVVELGPENLEQLDLLLEFDSTKITFMPNETGEEGADLNLMSFLSWGFLSDLKGGEGYDLREITWPADRRAGRRVFRLDPLPDEEGESQFVWGGATVTINAREDLIERMVIELSLGPVSLFTVTMEVAEWNRGLEESLFEYGTHVPEGTEVQEYRPEEE